MVHTPFRFEYWHGDSGPWPLCWGLDARNRPNREVRALLESESPAADLWEIAASSYAVDHAVPRPRVDKWREKEPEWCRRLALDLPVRRLDFWREHGWLIERLLSWMTGDEWSFAFHAADWIPTYYQQPLISTAEMATVLFSGGLDSAAGLAVELEQRSHAALRLVTVVTNTRQQGHCKELARELAKHARRNGCDLDTAAFHLNMTRRRPRETSARTRGFVFLSAAIATAVAYTSPLIRVYENGTGAMNLACSWGQVGTQSARPVHPRTLDLMERIAGAVADHPVRIENPYSHTTKAELLAQVPSDYDAVLDATVSCDTGFSRRAATRHCGVCTSCLLRVQSILASDKDLGLPEPGNGSASKRTHPRAMLWQVDRLRHAFRDGPSWANLAREFPDIVCVPGSFDPATQRKLLGLFSRYAQEWRNDELSAALGGLLDET
ncbi:7-cyano-7-deazaguanine synthase [Streptomonospora wellingtoniae]|uniref:7-cyano-7-deazaguanine synthase n=1 Tax=Streptomonospora wellingtoniae TaxID=3075544 RepID=A0ABU2L0Q7_9ACTN|nr:7-cyano-7-deazaguanine synthase [Streptomonospora sp. DSM 45055]MDT0304991.1 7-cyano-7-deazaguanine synthase [Streptomonospora sp. DSM 45055]